MALDISSSLWIWSCEAHVSPLNPIPLQIKQNQEIQSKDGTKWHLHRRGIQYDCVWAFDPRSRTIYRTVLILPRRKAPLWGVTPLCRCVQGQALSSHTWWRCGRCPLVWWPCSPVCRHEPGHRLLRKVLLRPEKWSILKLGRAVETSVGEGGATFFC